MKRIKWKKMIAAVFVVVMILTVLSGCGTNEKKEEEDTITVYLWSKVLYDSYAPYIQSQLPDINIEFVVGNNDLDFYKFMNEQYVYYNSFYM